MERLTRRLGDGVTQVFSADGQSKEESKILWDAIEKLADYEDAEEQGLLLHLPCKIGDDVYSVGGFCDYDSNEKCPFPEILCPDCSYWENCIKTYKFRLELLDVDTGELIDGFFVALEEAETELKEMEDSDAENHESE